VYLVTLASVYGAVRAGALRGPDAAYINGFLSTWYVKRALLGDGPVALPPSAVDFATAWLITKTTEPARLVGTIAVVPALARRYPALAAVFGVKEALDAAARP